MSQEDVYKLRIAALLHDITKEKSVEEHAALAAQYHIPLSDLEKSAPKVLHAKTAPSLARQTINATLGCCVVDDTVCDAIRTHTEVPLIHQPDGSAMFSLMPDSFALVELD